MVKLINVTNSHSRLVMNQLENTDAEMVKVYTAGTSQSSLLLLQITTKYC